MATTTAQRTDTDTEFIEDGVDDRLSHIVKHYKTHVMGEAPRFDLDFLTDTPDSEAVRALAVWFDGAARRPDEIDRFEMELKYNDFKTQLAKQFEMLRSFGYEISVVDYDPFGNVHRLVSYVRRGQRLPVMSTDTGDFPADHPLTNRTRYKDATGQPLCWNDLFRWVHDILGHVHLGADNAPFDLDGEWRTWMMHRQMFEGDARGILGTEAIAQIAWMAAAPRFDGDERPVGEREFPEQKITSVPEVIREAVAV